MKTVRFLVEGKKDVCFLQALFIVKFAEFSDGGMPDGSEDGVLLLSDKLNVEIMPIGGYTKLANAKSSAEDKRGEGLRVALIFDADVTGVESGGVVDRMALLKEKLSA